MISPCIRAQNQYAFSAKHTYYTPKKSSTAQKDKLTLQSVLQDLNRIKGVFFLYTQECIGNKMVNPVEDLKEDIETILDNILANSGLKYKKIKSNTFVIIAEDEKLHPGKEYKVESLSSEATIKVADPVKGRILSSDGTALSGVSVSVKGTRRGTATNNNGDFIIDVNKGETLVISYVGYQSQEYIVNNNNSDAISISLTPSSAQISEVVVTALGIRRERRSLGYSVSEVKGSELTQAREINVGNSLVGRVAGLNVNSVAGGPGASTNIVIRGISSLSSTNQPLYVINGIPVENKTNGQLGTQYDNGVDRGDAIGNINPDDIETISVLKGAAASALYGYRAKAGVILITTKSARGNGVDFNSNYVAEKIVDPTDWQYVYGQGSNNIKPTDQNAAFQSGQSSWGGKLDGSNVIQFDGVSRPYVAQKDNLKNFYRTGSTFTNTVALNQTFTGGNIRFSASDLSNNAVIPNSGLDRQSFNLTGIFNPIAKLTVDARANYILEQAKNRPFLSDGP
ncbi:MAG: TonB-dependent receptor plug domain-containing protein, partial [Chitinophagaceae bacterium]|nr:TonB-dependent receptor plug domain-containing protein [Chitinophagaceae bacterium]